MNEWDSFDELYNALSRCKAGKMWKASVCRFVTNGVEECLKLEHRLQDGSYKPRKPHLFKLYYPKERDCSSIHIGDRVVQRSLNDNVIYPSMVKGFIWNNFACQKGKGTKCALDGLSKILHRYYINHKSNQGYVLQYDIKSYYKSISHKMALDCLSEKLDESTTEFVKKCWNIQHPGEIGFEPGDQLIQIVGISFLNKLDHFIKEKLRIKDYLRYMDDFILIAETKEQLEYCKAKIDDFLGVLGLRCHPEKTKMYPISDGIMLLGFTSKLTSTGKVIRLIDPANVKHERKKIARMIALLKRGEMTTEKFIECVKSWFAHADLGNTYRVKQRIIQYIKENTGGTLWKSLCQISQF